MPDLTEVMNALRPQRYRFGTERDLQDGVEAVLVASGFVFSREHRIGGNPIDFLVDGGIGIESKVAGGPALVLEQLTRYAVSPEISALVLLTSRHTHTFRAENIAGKPFRVLWVAGRSL